MAKKAKIFIRLIFLVTVRSCVRRIVTPGASKKSAILNFEASILIFSSTYL